MIPAKLRLYIAKKLISSTSQLNILIARVTKPWKEYEATLTLRIASLTWSKPGGEYIIQPAMCY